MPIDSNTEWIHWGQVDPLYGVCSVVGKNRRQQAWTDEEFYSRSQGDWKVILSHWEQYGLRIGTCVEIGCGVGRMTQHLSRHFPRVEAIDVSPGMLEYARKHVNLEVVGLHLTDGTNIPLADGSASSVFSVIVFQHLDRQEHGFGYFREIARVLEPGGTMMINLPLSVVDSRYARSLVKLHYALRRIRTNLGRFVIKLGPTVSRSRIGRRLADMMPGTSYDYYRLMFVLKEYGFVNCELRLFYLATEDAFRWFLLGTRSSN